MIYHISNVIITFPNSKIKLTCPNGGHAMGHSTLIFQCPIMGHGTFSDGGDQKFGMLVRFVGLGSLIISNIGETGFGVGALGTPNPKILSGSCWLV